jgi:hypothetical protein
VHCIKGGEKVKLDQLEANLAAARDAINAGTANPEKVANASLAAALVLCRHALQMEKLMMHANRRILELSADVMRRRQEASQFDKMTREMFGGS